MKRRALPLLLMFGFSLSGCFGSKTPVTTVWTLPTPRMDSPGVNPDGPALGVHRLTSGAERRTTALTYRENDGRQLKRYPYDEWADYPDRMLHERLLGQLLLSAAFKSVTAAPPKNDLDAVLAVHLVEFDEWDEPTGVRVRVALRWRLERADGALVGAEFTAAERSCGKDVAQVVEAYESATTEVLESITERVIEFLAAT